MKIKDLVVVVLIAISSSSVAQKKIRLVEGDLQALRGQKEIRIEFSYDSMIVGEESETTYVEKMKDRWNGETTGKGDEWKQTWYDARTKLYEPTFRYSFSKASGMSIKSETYAYTIIFRTTLSEPGFNVPGIVAKPAYINATATIVNNKEPNRVIAKMTLSKFKSHSVLGGDFGVGLRLQEAYIEASKALGEFIKEKLSK